jgi:urease accessory protein
MWNALMNLSATEQTALLRVTDPRSGPRLFEAQRCIVPTHARMREEALHERKASKAAFAQSISVPRDGRAPLVARTMPPVASGQGSLELGFVAGQSTLTSSWATNPLKLLVPRPRGLSVWAFSSSFGGGLVAGDEIQLTLSLAVRTRCFLGTQASTKVYRNPRQRPCGHRLTASLGEDSLLVLAPDPVQMFAGSRYEQRQEFHLEKRAGLVLVDWCSAGRVARGERWAFTRFHSRNEIFVERERMLVDSLLLDSAHGPLDSPHRMGRFNCLALVVLLGEPVRAAAARILEDIANRSIDRGSSLIRSASPLADGAILRLAGEQAEAVGRRIQGHLSFLRDLLGDDPWARKW